MRAQLVNGKIEEHEDGRILSCPFCNGKGYWKELIIAKGFNKRNILPEGAKETKRVRTAAGKTYIYWERTGYGIHCMTPKCRCRTVPDGYRTLEEAIKAWNGGRNK